ncbi:MAG: hypothetical protein HQL90_13285 [Magnetococcales bacterium]|nr:hypothetical protein [Magnetococcales bacterium]
MTTLQNANNYLIQEELKRRVVVISKKLRQAQTHLHQTLHPDLTTFSQADIYFEPGPGGEYPIVALRSLPCFHFLQGHCTPCAYSARPRPSPDRCRDPYPGLLEQVDDLLSRFDELFLHRANGQLPGYRTRRRKHGRIYMLQLAGESSFFSDREIPPEYRRDILERFLLFGDRYEVDWHLMLETRPEDLTKAAQSGEINRLQPLFEALNVVVNMGFEHENEFLRQVIFAKDLDRTVFLQALSVAQYHGLDPGVFLFAGGFILTPPEALQQVARGLAFLEAKGAFVNVMLPNLQAFTLPDLLYHAGAYDLPEPPWLLGLTNLLLDYAPHRPDGITPGHWFIGGIVAEPVPVGSIMDHPRRRCPPLLADRLLKLTRDLMLGGSREAFERACKDLTQNPDIKVMTGDCLPFNGRLNPGLSWREEVSIQEWPQRTHRVLTLAEQQLDSYLTRKIADFCGIRPLKFLKGC